MKKPHSLLSLLPSHMGHIVMLCVLMCVAFGVTIVQQAAAQDIALDPTRQPQAGFVAYECAFDPNSNSAQIRAALTDTNGASPALDGYTIAATDAQSQTPLPQTRVTVAPIAQREPTRIVMVLDTTDTIPAFEIVTAIGRDLVPQMNLEDQMALITFAQRVNPITQFFTDKNKLINQYMLDLRTTIGDNRMYDAVLEAVSAFEADDPGRHIVLMLTDSSPRGQEQTPLQNIIARANERNVQIFNIAFFTTDAPDVAGLVQLSNATQGYTWIYDGVARDRASVGEAVGELLVSFLGALNSEIMISVDLSGLEPNAADQIVFDLDVTLQDERPLNARIICPFRRLTHSIAVSNLGANTALAQPFDVQVTVQSDLDPAQTTTLFWLNNEVVQNSAATRYTIDPTTLAPGPHTLRTELRDRGDTILASTSDITFYAQRPIQLATSDGNTDQISGAVTFEARLTPAEGLQTVEFRIGQASNEGITLPLAGGSAPIENGVARLTVEDIQAQVSALFPDAQGALNVSAFITGPTADAPLLAISNVLTFTLPPPAALPMVIPPAPTFQIDLALLIPLAFALLFLLLNFAMVRRISWTRTQGLIKFQDRHDLSDRLMAVTVFKDGTQKTHTLTKKTMSVGRGGFNDINLGDSPNVSRQHGVVMWRNKQWYYTNKKPRVRTKINSRRYNGNSAYRLEPITEIEVGDVLLVFHANAQQDVAELTKTNL
jgi:hypothetical protein